MGTIADGSLIKSTLRGKSIYPMGNINIPRGDNSDSLLPFTQGYILILTHSVNGSSTTGGG